METFPSKVDLTDGEFKLRYGQLTKNKTILFSEERWLDATILRHYTETSVVFIISNQKGKSFFDVYNYFERQFEFSIICDEIIFHQDRLEIILNPEEKVRIIILLREDNAEEWIPKYQITFK